MNQFSEGQLSDLTRWRDVYVDRLIVFGVPRSHVEDAVEESKHIRGTIKIDSLGLLEHTVVCNWEQMLLGLYQDLANHFLQLDLHLSLLEESNNLLGSERSNYYLS